MPKLRPHATLPWRWRIAAIVFVLLMIGLGIGSASAQKQAAPRKKAGDDLQSQIFSLRLKGEFAAAVPLAKRHANLLRRQHGEGHFLHISALEEVGELLVSADRQSEAEKVFRQALATWEKRNGPDADNGLISGLLQNLAKTTQELGKLDEAEAFYLRAIRAGDSSIWAAPELPDTLTRLGKLYHSQSRWQEAEAQLARAVSLREADYKEKPDLWNDEIAEGLEWLGDALQKQFRFVEAETVLRRALEIRERHLDASDLLVARSLNDLADVLDELGRYREAEALYRRGLAIHEARLGPEHPEVATNLKRLSSIFLQEKRLAEYEQATRRALVIWEKAHGPETLMGAALLNNLALLFDDLGRHSEAEPLHLRGLAIREKVRGSDSELVAESLNNLGDMLNDLERHREAEQLLRRALAIREKVHGPAHPEVAVVLGTLATALRQQERYEEAVGLRRLALDIQEKALGPEHPDVSVALNNLGIDLEHSDRADEAIPLYERSLAIKEKRFGAEHREVAATLINLSVVYRLLKRFAEAEPPLLRALAIMEKLRGEEHQDFLAGFMHLINLHRERENWQAAMEAVERYFRIHRARSKRADAAPVAGSTRREEEEVNLNQHRWYSLMRVAHAASVAGKAEAVRAQSLAFEMAQLAERSQAAAALSQMSVRFGSTSPALAAVVREQQDLVKAWSEARNEQLELIAQTSQAKDSGNAQVLRDRLASLDNQLTQVERRLKEEFPEYFVLTNPGSLSIEEARALLRPGEALLQFLVDGKGTFLWVVTEGADRWIRAPLDNDTLIDRVQALRCGLDATAWQDAGEARCRKLLDVSFAATDAASGKPLPFDPARAHDLYKGLLGEAEDLIRGKHLLLVLSSPLTSLPFQVLVTEPMQTDKAPSWLVHRHAMTVLPSVASLKALRQHAKPSQATSPFIGFGNPLLVGRDGTDRSAWTKQGCPKPEQTVASQARMTTAVAQSVSHLLRGGLADVEAVRRQPPLPETADELCAVARLLGADPERSVHLGDKAREARLKALDADGTLAKARVVHFATHGLLADETKALIAAKAEPALMLTPPESATDGDDGLLTASEVASLRLDADWVVMSACNTEGRDAEPLSGLARAFFYAGARSLLVSHWYVDSDATVALITKAFGALEADRTLDRAEALRQAMRSLIDAGGTTAHPAYWAPFVVVGEGGR